MNRNKLTQWISDLKEFKFKSECLTASSRSQEFPNSLEMFGSVFAVIIREASCIFYCYAYDYKLNLNSPSFFICKIYTFRFGFLSILNKIYGYYRMHKLWMIPERKRNKKFNNSNGKKIVTKYDLRVSVLNYSPCLGSEWGNIENSLLFVMWLQAVPVPVPPANNSLLHETGESSSSQPASQSASQQSH